MSEPKPEKLYETCEEVGICDMTRGSHWFYWDCDRDTKRMNRIHGTKGKGHADPLSEYGAVMCKHCSLKALVKHDSEDFPEI